MTVKDIVQRRVVRWNGRRRAQGLPPQKHGRDFVQQIVALVNSIRQCRLCGQAIGIRCVPYRALSIDHRLPVIRRGADEIENIDIICCSCNSKKGDYVAPELVIAEWLVKEVSCGQTVEAN